MTPRVRPAWRYAQSLAPVALVWLVLVGWLASLLYGRAHWSDQADEAIVREWLDEARSFRKTLPELVREYAQILAEEAPGDPERPRRGEKRDEIAEQMRALAEPTRAYLNLLPGFPVVYRLEVRLEGDEPVSWVSPLPRPRQAVQSPLRTLDYRPFPRDGGGAAGARIVCEYQLHAFNKLQSQELERRRVSVVVGAVLAAAALLTGVFVTRFGRRERSRELDRLAALAEAEHAERELLETRLKRNDAERQKEELDRKLLEQQLDAAKLERRAAEAEMAAVELRSQLYAGIGIMAGSYAHNIKNLLVRPQDLLERCIESPGLPGREGQMLVEVKSTLGTVTERLQQILKTVRRDPTQAELAPLNLSELVRETAATWGELAREKWKLDLKCELPAGPDVWISGDYSHLQQAIENLVFNARDATFEMRGKLRDEARAAPPGERKAKLLDAAKWRGRVGLTLSGAGDTATLSVRDNGVGMTNEVRENCLKTHFTTKRDNALYEGYSAGMGLGLSFVAVVLEHHGATLVIESEPGEGAEFCVEFPRLRGPAS